ncbi:MAG TPA: glycosyltransferase family 2 protein [Solimonas sp.]|nr:glycosyltransferase family 2 protein [Solimonas sp.]
MESPVVPVVSVALCTYNGARFLRQQLDSILAQSLVQIEVVAVDDVSGDDSWAILQDYAARDCRVRAFRNEANLGFIRNFEAAVQHCRAALIAPADQDDVWHADKLQRLVDNLGDASAIYCDSELVDADGASLGQRISDRLAMYEGRDPAAFVFLNCVSGHALLFRRELLATALPFPRVQYHDWWLAFVAASAQGIRYWPEPLVQFRQHAASATDISGRKERRRPEDEDRNTVFEARVQWLHELRRVPGQWQPYFDALYRSCRSLAQRWFSLELWRLMWQRREALFWITRGGPLRRLVLMRRYAIGMPPKQWLSRGYKRRPLKLPD